MTDEPEDFSKRDQATLLLRMGKEAKQLERKLGAAACVLLCMFEGENGQIIVQDAGRFPMPPADFYGLIIQAHVNGQLGHNSPKLKTTKKLILPN